MEFMASIISALRIFSFFFLIYLMFFTRKTVLRVCGWAVYFMICFSIFWFMQDESSPASSEATKIINDLSNLRGAVGLFRENHGRSPLPGEEASLDLYSDRPIVAAEPPRYAKVTLTGELSNDMGVSGQYVGVQLIPEKNGTSGIQKKMAARAKAKGLLELPSGDKKVSPYESGLNVYMEIPLN
jgi:hypothetical protein